MFLPSDRTIGRTVDSGIGENPISRYERRLKKFTSNLAEARVIDADEQKRSHPPSAPLRELCRGGDRANGGLLRVPSRESVCGAPPSTVLSQRSLDCTAWAHDRGGHRRHRANRRGSSPRIRCAIPDSTASAYRGDQSSDEASAILHRASAPATRLLKTPHVTGNCQSTRF